MDSRRQLAIWLVAAVVAVLGLVAILVWWHRAAETYWSSFLVGNPHQGSHTFREKGCGRCHPVNGSGSGLAPDLGFQPTARATLNELVTEMWNHAPEMWRQIEEAGMPYPSFNPREMADLFAYLYTARYVDEPGDTTRGWRLFSQKGCLRCHAVHGEGGTLGPDLEEFPAVVTPILWAQTMWNHASVMETAMEEMNIEWPRFEAGEMNDLLAFARQTRAGPLQESAVFPADPGRGWELFREKACIECHSAGGKGGTTAPDLGSGEVLGSSLSELAGQMWNHSPSMWQAMRDKGVERPNFAGREMADLIAFLYSVRYFDLAGSPVIGKQVFSDRTCSRCHGEGGAGGEYGPRLRGRGRVLTPVTFARAMWVHGPRIYELTRELGMDWPKLEENDLGHLLVFLNTPPENDR